MDQTYDGPHAKIGQAIEDNLASEVSGPDNRGSESLITKTYLCCRDQERKKPNHLRDYLCYSASTNYPSSTSLLQTVSSGTPHPLEHYANCEIFFKSHKSCLATITKFMDARYSHQATRHTNWREAMIKHIETLELNKTRIIEGLPLGMTLINCKWIHKVKYNSD